MIRVPPNPALDRLAECLRRIDRGVRLREELLMQSPSNAPVPYARPLLDAVALFDELGIGYALIGGVAAMYYGRARFTDDVDFVAVTGHMRILEGNPEAMRRHHFDPACVWKLYHESGVEIDLWKDEHSDGIVSRAVSLPLAGRSVRLADVHDLIAMKLRAGRIQDDYDISEILKTPEGIDESRVRAQVTEAQFGHFGEIKRRTPR